jgi:Methyltransferase domain
MTFNPIDYPLTFLPPEWKTYLTAWHGHLPFASFAMSALTPRLFVELGVMFGDSYCTFCQAVKAQQLDTKCYGIDSWQGDEHAGTYTENDFLPGLREHHDIRYGNFSTLLQSFFDEAVSNFSDGSIDLLHIDGLHTYEAVKHDFETWLPKMSEQGVVLFHDTNVYERDFGVHQFWAEVSKCYPHFEFLHSHGLGVLAVGKTLPKNLLPFFQASEAETERLRFFFESISIHTTSDPTRLKQVQIELQLARAQKADLARELFQAQGVLDDYTNSRALKIARLAWQVRKFFAPTV